LFFALARLALAPLWTLSALFGAFATLFTSFALAAFGAFGARFTLTTLAFAAIAVAAATAAAPLIAVLLAIGLLLLLFARREIDIWLIAALLRCATRFPVMHFRGFGSAFVALKFAFVEILRLRRRGCRLHLAHEPEIMIGVLCIVLAENTIAGAGRIA
jgi:hypothetical protein